MGLKTSVAIIGAGPVGMHLAMNLAALGVDCLLADRDETTRAIPRGNTHNARTMEHFRRLGLAARLRDLGLPPDHPTDVAYFNTLAGQEIARLTMPSEREKRAARDAAGPADQIVEPILRANQMYVEAAMARHLETLPQVALRRGRELTGFADRGSHVLATLADAQGREEQVECRYLVGCDGGNSLVRKSLGIGYAGKRPEERAYASGAMISTYLHAPGVYDLIRRPAWQYWAVNPGIRGNLTSLDGRGHFLMNTKVRSEDTRPDLTTIRDYFQRVVGAAVPVELLAHTPWTAGQALVADGYGRGRVLLAGDAVHLFTPTGGFGMNTGVDDAANLGWKLAAMVQGWGGPGLVPSYEAERRPIAFRNTGAAKRMSLESGDVPVGPDICDPGPAGEADRARAAAVISTFGNQYASIGVQLGARYDHSPVICAASDHVADDPEVYVPTSAPGGRAPHGWLDGHVSLFDRFGPGFTLLALDPGAATAAFETAAAARGIPLRVVTVDQPALRDLYGCGLALIRPDQHVAWRGNTAEGAEAVLAQVTGW